MVASDEEMTAGDAAMLDALYRDADGDAGLDAAQRSTLAEWRAVRGVVRHAREQGFDAEPPAAGTRGSMEMLMAAARAHAAPERQGLWARLRGWLTTMVAHPAMAGAAALVVVGGAAGVLYLNGKSEVARPPAAERWREAESPAMTPGPGAATGDGHAAHDKQAADQPSPTMGVGAGRGDLAGSAAAGPAETKPATPPEGGRPERTAVAPRAPAGAKPPPAKPADRSTSGGLVDSLESETLQAGGDRLEEPPGSGEDDRGRTGSDPTERADDSPPPMASPPPPPPVVTTTTTSRPATRPPAQIAVDDENPSARSQAVQLTSQARASAKAGDCAKVTQLSKQVTALDAAYHRDVFVRDPDIAKCR